MPVQPVRIGRIDLPTLAITYYITRSTELAHDDAARKQALLDKVRAAFAAGVDVVQVREKHLTAREVADIVDTLAGFQEKKTSRLLVNERLDIAATCHADGVHMPAHCAPIAAVRAAADNEMLIGVSCHDVAEVALAVEQGASYVLLSPIFATASKPGVTPLGLSTLELVCRRFSVPVYALGGITAANAEACVRAGAAGLAGISLYQQTTDLTILCCTLRQLAN